MDSVSSYTVAFLFAVLVHGVVIGLMSINWNQTTMKISDIRPYYIDATVVTKNPYTPKQDRESTVREKKLRQRRLDEAKFRKQQAKWQEDQKRTKAAPVVETVVETRVTTVEPEAKPVIEEPVINEESARSSFEEELSLAVIDEQNLRKAVTDDEKAMAYVAQIQREIIQNWSRPPSARNGMEALLRVRLVPTGEVIDVKLEASSGNDSFDRSAMLAVRKSQRFVVPSDAMRFERDFREFTVLFRPDDLRL